MATVTTDKFISPVIAPYDTSNVANINLSGIPWGGMSHVDQFDVAAIGAGDVGLLRIFCYVPANYLCVLNGFHIDQECTSEPKWESGAFSNYYLPENAFSSDENPQLLYFPLAVTSEARIGSNGYKNVGISNAGQNSAYDVNSPVNFVFKGDRDSPTICPRVQLYNTTEGIHNTTFRVAINWKLYDISQGNRPFLGSI